eukprot:jgi/Mesen1/7908/ME000420S07053
MKKVFLQGIESAKPFGMAAKQAFIGAIDQGTTSTRFILYNEKAQAVASHQLEFEQVHPQASWVEHKPTDILETVRSCMSETMAKAAAAGIQTEGNVRAIGITNQRETTIMWSKSTGKPLHNAIVWMDARTNSLSRQLEKELEGGRDHFKPATGLPISTYFSALKVKWLLDNVPLVKQAVRDGDALFGTVDSWLIWNLTGGCGHSAPSEGGSTTAQAEQAQGVHVTDCSNASRTMLMDLRTLQWHQETLETLGIPAVILPRIVSNSEEIGRVAATWPLAGVPISGCLGDQHAAMLGQRCRVGEAKSTYGTGCFVLLNTGGEICASRHGLLSTLAYRLGPRAAPTYALEGSIAIAGAAVQWLRDGLGLIERASDVEALAASVEDTGGVYFVPAFSGLFAPWWRDDARGVCVGISRYTHKGHIARAVLESMCFQARDVLVAMHKDVEGKYKDEFVLRVDGGASANNLMLQLQADLLGAQVVRPADIETTALGAAYAAGLASGLWTEEELFGEELRGVGEPTVFTPRVGEESRQKRCASWLQAVEKSYDLADSAP